MKYAYTAFDKAGKQVAGSVEAADLAQARDSVRAKGLYVTDIRDAADAPVPVAMTSAGKRLGTGTRLKCLAMFSRQLYVLISSGTPIVQSLLAIERQAENATWQKVLSSLRSRVEEGTPLSEAMRQQGAYFDAVTRSLVAAGESSGNMPAMLDRLASLARKQLYLRSSVLGALVYPCVLIGLGTAVLITMLMFVIPRFSQLFANLDSPLPPTTKFLLWISGMLWSYWWAIIIVLASAFFTVRWWIKSPSGRRSIHTTMLNLPKVGKLTRNLMTAKLSRMLGTLLESKVPLLDALQLTKQSSVNLHYTALIAKAEDAVGRGEPISAVLGNTDLIAACVQEAVRNGEQSGQIGQPLLQMADFLDEENDVVIKALTSVIEPAILIGLGMVVGFIAISMFLPMFDLVSAAHG